MAKGSWVQDGCETCMGLNVRCGNSFETGKEESEELGI